MKNNVIIAYAILKTWIFCLLLSLAMLNCSSGNPGTNLSSVGTEVQRITIDNAGIVPVFMNSSTASIIYVRNNSNQTISNIQYSITSNTENAGTNDFTLDAGACTTLAPNSRCALQFTTPVVSGSDIQGSAVLEASYGQSSFSQVISYRQIANNTQAGIIIDSGVTINTLGTATGYAMLYAYAGAGQNYILSGITINNSALSIIDDYVNLHVERNTVIPIEVSGHGNVVTAELTLNSVTASDNYTTHSDIKVIAYGAAAILVSGLSPVLNVSTTQSGSFKIINAGNQSATLGTITYPTYVSAATGSGACGATLAAHAQCTFYFTIAATTSNISGVNISVPYTYAGGSNVLSQLVTWYNNNVVLLALSINPSKISITSVGSAIFLVIVNNLSTQPVTNLSIPTPQVVSGNAVVESVIINDSCTGTSLAVGASCTYALQVRDSVNESNNQITVGITGTYSNNGVTKTYTRVLAGTYSSSTTGYAYVTNYLSSFFNAYRESSNGVLTSIGTYNTPSTAGITFSPYYSKYLYVTNLQSNVIAQYGFNPATGALSLTNATAASTQNHAPFIIFAPSGNYLYAVNQFSNTISEYSFNATTGALTLIGTVATGNGPLAMIFSPLGKYAYVANANSNTISQYSVNVSTGILSPLSPATVATGSTPWGIQFDPSGQFVYTPNSGSNTVSQYKFNSSNGQLVPLSPATVNLASGQSNALSIGFDPAEQYAYVSAVRGISQYSINSSTGQLTLLTPQSISINDTFIESLIFDRSGKYAYVIGQSTATVYQYFKNSNGQLQLIGTVGTGNNPINMVVN